MIAEGLEYLHDQGVVHGNVRGANVLVDNKFHILLTNFNIASLKRKLVYTGGDVHTVPTRWAAPEHLAGWPTLKFSSDVYAFTCTCIEVCCRSPAIGSY